MRNITGKCVRHSFGGFGSTALEMKLDKLDEHPGFLWIFFQVARCHFSCRRKKPPGSLESLECLESFGGLGVEGAAPSCHSQQLPKLP